MERFLTFEVKEINRRAPLNAASLQVVYNSKDDLAFADTP
jgi:hypothetical protein